MRIRQVAMIGTAALALSLGVATPSQATHCPYPPNTSTLSLNAFPLVINAGGSTFFKGYLTENRCAIPGKTINFYARYPGGQSTYKGNDVTDSAGVYTKNLAFPRNFAVRTLFTGDTSHPTALSREILILVRTRISASVTSRPGCVLQWGGTTFPQAPSGTLAILQQQVPGGVRDLVSTRTVVGGGFGLSSRVPCGRYAVRVILNRTPTNADGISPFAIVSL